MASTVMPPLRYQVQEMIYDSNTMRDEVNFYNQRQGSPSELTKKLTYILGDYNKLYPLASMTLGGIGYGNSRSAIELDDVQFTYPVMGRDIKATPVLNSDYVAGDKPGYGNQPFYINFPDNYIKRFTVIRSESGVQAYTLAEGEPIPTGGFRYKVQLASASNAQYCPISQLQSGIKWTSLFTPVAESESRTTETTMVMPGLFKNQMSFMRSGMSWAGNSANKVMKIDITTDKGTTNVWMDYFMWQFEKNWISTIEHFFWYAEYNRLLDGTIPLKDPFTGKPIPIGAGALEQITNTDTYTRLTYDILRNKVGDALFGQSDTANMSITLFTGRGGMREFDRAMKEAGAQILGPLGAGDIASKFVTGTGYNLALGGYFDTFYHIDGYVIKVKYNPIFDIGKVAIGSPLHPESGLPLESYRMVFLDDSDFDGQPNIQYVAQKGRSFIHKVIPGLTPMPRSLEILLGRERGVDSDNLAVTDIDKSSYVRMASAGIQIRRGNRCFHLRCIAGAE